MLTDIEHAADPVAYSLNDNNNIDIINSNNTCSDQMLSGEVVLSASPSSLFASSSNGDSENSVVGLNVPSSVDDSLASVDLAGASNEDSSQDIEESSCVRSGVPLSNEVVGSDNVLCHATKASPLTNEDLFFQSQELGTVVEPQCGGCKCSKCPIPGMKYTFKEQQAFDIVQKNLVYCEIHKRWFVEYPWAMDRSSLCLLYTSPRPRDS